MSKSNFKLFIFTLIFSTSAWFSYAQVHITGKVINAENNQPIASANVINIASKDTLLSNNNGSFVISNSGRFLIEKAGFISKEIVVNKKTNILVELFQDRSLLDEVIVTANPIPSSLKKASATVNIISKQDIERGNNINFAKTLNRVPGVFMQSGALNTNRITIRGIGSRNLYGTAKIRAYFKDIPLTNGSGETNIEDFELGTITEMEIIKGAIIFGAGLGGTINLKPTKGEINQSLIKSGLTVGSFGLLKGITHLNHGTKNNNFSLTHSHTESDGFRENNAYNRETVTFNSNHSINPNNQLTFLASYVDLKAFIPSSINEESFQNNPEVADTNWKSAQGYEDSERGILGISWNHNFNKTAKLSSSTFLSFRNAYEPRPFNILEETSLAYGVRSRLLGNINLFNKKLKYAFGGELFKDNYQYQTFENLYKEYPEGTGSISGNKLSDFKEKRWYYNLFLETNYEISKKTTISMGANLNQTAYHLNDRFPISNNNPDQSGKFKFKTIISPKFGASHQISETTAIYGNISHGFSPLTLSETLLPSGQINPNLKPETGWNFEIGTRGLAINNRLQYNIALYRMDIKNLLVSRRTAQDQYIGINAGKTQHDGLETAFNFQLKKNKNIALSVFCNHTLNRYIFKEFINDTEDYSGNDLTGVPSQVFNAGIDMDCNFGLYGNVNFQHVGKIPITDSNNLYSNNYNLTNLKLGFKSNLNKNLKLNTFFGLNNIFDTAYASQILINATGFGGSAPRYYYPGNPVNFYTGIHVNYIF